MSFPDDPKTGSISLRAVSEERARASLVEKGFKQGGWLANCSTTEQWYIGSANRGQDHGPVVACAHRASRIVYAVFKSLYKVEVAINWSAGSSSVASSFVLPNGSVDHWSISFREHFDGDGAVVGVTVRKLTMSTDVVTSGGGTSLTVKWFVYVAAKGSHPTLSGFGRVKGTKPAKLTSLPDRSTNDNTITLSSVTGDIILDVLGASYTKTEKNERTLQTLVLRVKVLKSPKASCKSGTSGTIRLELPSKGHPLGGPIVARQVCGTDHWRGD